MTRFVLLDTGEELSEATLPALVAAERPVALKLLGAARPFREGQIVHVTGVPREARSGDPVLCHADGGFRLCARREVAADEVLGHVTAVQRGTTSVALGRGLLGRLPFAWLAAVVDALDVLGRLRHPLTPPLFQGSVETCLARVRRKYESAAEVGQYSRQAAAGAAALELELVRRHVKPGGRLLDVGCGAGREALGFARAGFDVVAIDLAPAMIEAARANARREGLGIAFRVQSMTELDEPPGSFDGAFCTAALNHVPGRALRVATLARVARALGPGGVLILGVIYRQPLGLFSRTRLVDFLRVVGARLLGPRRFSEPGDGWMREVSEASDPGVPVFLHEYAGPDEVRREIDASGFSGEEVAASWWVCRTGQIFATVPESASSKTVNQRSGR